MKKKKLKRLYDNALTRYTHVSFQRNDLREDNARLRDALERLKELDTGGLLYEEYAPRVQQIAADALGVKP